ncbi:hypothetical protein [Flavobacterium sp.]|uniref:hypothetical protein n=1 Tax=Flavobacterium sp. TaxID=239 RepID=UPI0012235187|nr:hypothetical protein [Flavobacterium sp.]RZJ69317.1 MAG: hypothetical protein EOO49_17975 [Flavobacterium sp.]
MEKDFEKELGRKFNGRTIEPSGNAWERVNLQRGKVAKKRTPIIYWIAAAVILGIGISFMDFRGEKPIQSTPIATSETAVLPSVKPKQNVQKVAPIYKVGNHEVKFVNPTPFINEEIVQIRQPETAIDQPIAPVAKSVQQQKADQILIALEQMAASGRQPTTDDVDLLIEKARKEIAAGRGLPQQTDANALLKDSESELDESFRSGIFENLFKQKRIRVAFGNH